ncbi:MAG: anti-sigma factor family protein [Salinispira sp.]
MPLNDALNDALNDDILMELLDNEVPEQYRSSVEARVLADPALAPRLEAYQLLQKTMREDDEGMSHAYAEAAARVEALAGGVIDMPEQNNSQNNSQRSTHWIAVFAAALLIFAFFFVSENTPSRFPQNFNLVNTSEFSEYNASSIEVLPVNTGRRGAAGANNAGGAGGANKAEGAAGTNGAGSTEGIDLQVNVQDIEQLLRFLEGIDNLNGSINTLTIQLPDINEFELLGESRFIRAPFIEGDP